MSPDDGVRAWLRPRWIIARRDLRSLRVEKTIVLAIMIQLVIAGFSSFLVVGLVSLYDPGSVDGFEVEVAVTGNATESLETVADDQSRVTARTVDAEEAERLFESGQVLAVLSTQRGGDGRLLVRAIVPESGVESTFVTVQLQEFLLQVERLEREGVIDRLETEPVAVPEQRQASPYFGFTYTILLPLLLFLPVFISGSIAVDSLIEERQRGTLELLRVAPLPLSAIFDAKLIGMTGLATVQAAIWIALLHLNGITIASPLALVILVAALSLLVVGAGLGIALYAPDRRQAQLLFSGGIVAALVLVGLAPEHTANTVAKLAIGTAGPLTGLHVAGYLVGGLALVLFVRSRVDSFVANE
ncbi:MAG: ABC transporter permease [Natrialbaceae archaeon]|nr:ABC transporter permease [Natrialbaceae archaeon]